MEDKRDINNIISICGKISSNFAYSHEVYGEKFYNFKVSVERYSGFNDILPVTVSERLIDVTSNLTGEMVSIRGSVRTFNQHDGGKNRLIITVFAQEIELVEDGTAGNDLYLHGFICKNPIYRKTPLGREIADILLAVNRSYGKTDYIPCVVWGRNARFVGQLEVGTHIEINGRIQSRGYVKMHEDGTEEQRTAYEVSVSKINVLEEEN
jgi:primosomal replication protein N